MTKIDSMRGVNAKLAELKATTDAMTLDQRKAFESLAESIRVDAAAVDGPKRRLASVKAAAASVDPKTKEALRTATLSLGRLGLTIESIAASGSVAEIDKLAGDRKWNSTQRFALKIALGTIGALD
jgi:hypothetical protein